MKIMYDTYLTYAQVKEYLEFLWKNELIEYNWKTRHYKITAKGKKFLADPEYINNLISSDKKKNVDKVIPIRWY